MKKLKKKSNVDGSIKPKEARSVESLLEEIKNLKVELKRMKDESAKWNRDVSQLVADRYNVMLCLYGIAKREDGLARDYIRGMMTIPRFKESFKHIKNIHKSASSVNKIIAKVKQDE